MNALFNEIVFKLLKPLSLTQ